ncbi:abortive infection system antitoxin AbiGi family protein [Flavobacterium sp. HTF]|uniref:abortive infection system antitoxin AbiGi family protein n=1 Tax=Flavobacterium sp. HTF TaxID=2170732 RepID=UPI000D5FDD06|nr:abortive infection system antitoxin AbiGi family protein [Flavobacterium sp. HTF]PWB20656.1 hypothetical protein DCO46_20405 [Flavobacterium sp. HTF]
MAISTNSIIHYTKTLKNLFGILENGFSLKYCKEEFHFGQTQTLKYAYPMVCFCDIPLSEVKNHLDSYGHYGIGLSKEWAVKKMLNPVLYLEKESALTKSILQQALRIADNRIQVAKNPSLEKIDEVWRQELMTTTSYMKNYEGNLIVKGKEYSNYRFYNEREWRYVPTKEELGKNKRAVQIELYEKDKNSYNKELQKVKLDFDLSTDISYIIVKSKEDIHKVLEFISIKFKKKLLAAEIEILMTKIITTNQIVNDF